MNSRSIASRRRRARDAGLRRVSKLTRWSLAGALTGTGVFAGLAAQAPHGAASSTKTITNSVSGTSTPGTQASTSSRSSSDDDGASNASSVSGTSGTSSAPTPATTPVTQAPFVMPSQGSVSVVSGAS